VIRRCGDLDGDLDEAERGREIAAVLAGAGTGVDVGSWAN